jgi:hypothetical protein
MHGGIWFTYNLLAGNHLEDLGMDGKIILKTILKK